jgi:hypothetical protein
MRIARLVPWSFALGLGLACAAAGWPSRAAADDDHRGKRHERKRDRRVVVRVEQPACPQPVEHRWSRWHRYEPHRRSRPVYWAPPPVCDVRPARHCRYYYDPYCERRFSSLTIYLEHTRHHRHASFALGFDSWGEGPTFAFHWSDGGWRSRDID